MENEAALTIGEVARKTGLATSTLRYWERVGILAAPRRVHGQRRYGPEALERMALVEIAKRTGFSLAEIRVFLAGLSEDTSPPEVWEQLARRKLPDVERQLAETQAMKRVLEEGLQCECVSLQDCVGWASPHGRGQFQTVRTDDDRAMRQTHRNVAAGARAVSLMNHCCQPSRQIEACERR